MMHLIFSTLVIFLSISASVRAGDLLMPWCREETDALQRASEENRPIVLAFVGADFCPWSQKIIGEVFAQSVFLEKMQQRAVLWQYALQAEGNSKEEQMRKRYKIEECPTILLLDPKGREFARYGYLPLDAEGFADRLVETIADFKEICAALDAPEGKEKTNWQELYRKAQQFSSMEFKKLVLERGIRENGGSDLLVDKYELILKDHKIRSTVAREWKKMLLQKDPDNHLGLHFKMAMAEFHKCCAGHKVKKDPKKALKPLLHYLEHFADKDKENVWNAEMTIAQYLFAAKKIEHALAFAKKAKEHAPEAMKEGIGAAIAYMESK
jgi:hypothetical protein